jgi:hypothetical protein
MYENSIMNSGSRIDNGSKNCLKRGREEKGGYRREI